MKPLTQLNPELKLIIDERPPRGQKIYGITYAGVGVLTDYLPEYRLIAWMPLPKLTKEQKVRLRTLQAQGISIE